MRLAADDPENRVLLTTFSDELADGLRDKIGRLTQGRPEVAARITIGALPEIAWTLSDDRFGPVRLASDAEVAEQPAQAASVEDSSIDSGFLKDEWRLIVDAWDVRDVDTYLELPRLGRKVRMAASRRDELWRIFSRVRTWLADHELEIETGLMHRLASDLRDPPFTHVVVDEAQDISVPELRFVAAIGGGRPNGLFFAGDIGQRIFRSPFPWKAAGVDIQGRSRSLKVNYRTSH